MADQKLVDKTAQTTLADTDIFATVDVSDLSASPDGTSKKTAWSLIKSTLAGLTESITGIKTFVNGLIVGTATGTSLVDSTDTQTDVAGTTYGAKFITNHEPTAAANSTTYAIGGRYQYDGAFENANGGAGVLGLGLASGLARPNILMGGDFIANYNGTSTAVLPGSLYAGRFNVRLSNGGYYNHIMGIKINAPILIGGATAGSVWGIYISDIDVAGATTYAALNISGTGENNAITFEQGVTKLWQEADDLKTNENFVFANTKYLKFENAAGTQIGNFGMTGGDDMQLLTDESVVIKSNSTSSVHKLKLRNGNGDFLLDLRFSDGQATFLGDIITPNINLNALPTFADEAAASALTTGDVYKTATGELRIKL
tara:strand:- start:16644 stop:17759 length:1116 start_codon:yes stop_codon:yes gene_type:complete